MHDAPTFVADLAMVVGVAAGTSLLARRLGQPAILGYLFAGLIVGPALPFPLFADIHRVHALAEFGVVLVMFAIGLEFRVAKLLRVLPVSGFAGLMQVGLLLWAGFIVGRMLGWDTVGSAFLGASIAISSTMLVTGVFAEQPVTDDVRDHVLGVLVVQDVVAIVLIAAMTALAAGQDLAAGPLAFTIAQLAGVLIGMLGLGMLVVPKLARHVVQSGGQEGIAVLAVGLAFGFALLAEQLGYSVALGAFVAGILVAESGHGQEVEHTIAPLRAVFAAVFFVSIGMTVDPGLALQHLDTALLVALVVVLAQLGSITVASVLSGSPLRRAVISGLALGQIGEFSFIIATIGVTAGVVPPVLMATLVTVATVTAFTTPMFLRRGDALVDRLDHWMPDRLQRLMALYQTWVERLQGGGEGDMPMRRAAFAIAADGLGLVLLTAASLTTHHLAASWLADLLGTTLAIARILVNGATVLLALPLLVGLVRNARSLAVVVARVVLVEPRPGSTSDRVATQVLEAVVHLVLLLGVGIPALAVLRPLMEGPWGESILVVGLIGAIVVVWRKLGAVEGEFRSGAESIARVLAQSAGAEATHDNFDLLPGLDHVLGLPLAADAHAVGRTLAELNLRVRTGATVVAIHKVNGGVLLPNGHERLEQGDVLGLTGSTEAVQQARALLTDGPVAAARVEA